MQASLETEIETASGGVLYVRNRLAVRTPHGRPQVRTTLYRYHGRVRGRGRDRSVDVLRYDNAHGDTGTLHRHVYDDAGRDTGTEPVALEALPPLGDIVWEVERRARRLRGRRVRGPRA